MDKRKIITYIKNGKEKTKELSIITRKEITNDLFDEPHYQCGGSEFYKINDDIEFLTMNNIRFSKNFRMVIPTNSIVILNNCIFKGVSISFIDGSIELNNPILNPDYYTNRIYLTNIKDTNIVIGDNNRSFITITGTSNNFTLDAYDRLVTVSINGTKATLKNIQGINELKLFNKETNIKNCNFLINLKNYIQNIQTETLNIDNSNISYQSELDTSNERIIKTDKLNLKDTTISTNNYISIQAKYINMDILSDIKTKNKIKILNDTYQNKKDGIKIDLRSIKELNNRRELISTLKGVRKSLTEDKTKKLIKRI